MTFQIHALPAEPFAPLFDLTEAELAARAIHRSTVRDCPGTPCRVSLEDAQPGETVLLLNHTHQPAQTPYRSSHAIFVRQGAAQAHPAPGVVPEMIQRRLISLRLFDANNMMIDADVIDGQAVASALDSAFSSQQVAYAHLHIAKPGCFAASVTRTPVGAI